MMREMTIYIQKNIGYFLILIFSLTGCSMNAKDDLIIRETKDGNGGTYEWYEVSGKEIYTIFKL